MISPHEHSLPATGSTKAAPDLELVRKYSTQAPRYTSYPPATRFHERVEEIDVNRAILEDNADSSRPLSLYFHLPFCETRCWYCGCTTVITRDRGAADLYLDDLERELALYAPLMNRGRRVAQVHLGGGTPTFLSPAQLDRLGTLLRRNFEYDHDTEFGVEIDPRRVTLEHVEALRRLGANRASLGIQDTEPRVQLAIHRHQPHELNVRTMEWLRAMDFRSINVDLIYGLPLQTLVSFERTLDAVIDLSPDRFSVFAYAHVPWMKPAQKIFDERKQLPTTAERLQLWALAQRRLVEAGYMDIGLDHFARPNDELAVAQAEGTLHRNFQGYSTCAGASLYGFGMSSISSLGNVYAQNHRELFEYRQRLVQKQLPIHRGLRLTEDDVIRRTVIMQLMCHRRLDFEAISGITGVDFANHFRSELSSLGDLVSDGAVEIKNNILAVTPRGTPLLRVIALRFDASGETLAGRHAAAV